jgi:thymidylate kinase
MAKLDPAMRERVIDYIAAWVAHQIGEPTGEITIHEMQEFLYQHGYELTPPDEETTFTAADYWQSVIWVTKRRLENPDRVLKTRWKE